MALPSDWYIDKGEANQAIAQQQQLAQESSRLLAEIIKQLLKQKDKNTIIEVEPPEKVEVLVIDDRPILPGVEVLLIESAVEHDRPALPSFNHRSEQVVADTAQMLVNQLGDQGIYQAEGYAIRRDDYLAEISLKGGGIMKQEQTLHRVWNSNQQEILVFQEADLGYNLLTNNLHPNDIHTFLKARLSIEQDGLDLILSDRTFTHPIDALGDLAPIGSQAAHFAQYVLDGYESNTLTTPKYHISRDPQSNITIAENQSSTYKAIGKPAHTPGTSGTPTTTETIHNPSGKVLLRTEEGHITTFTMTTTDHQAFTKLFKAAIDKPLNQVVTPPTRSVKPQVTR